MEGGGEEKVYLLVRVVHVVGHGVKTSLAGAGITRSHAAVRRRRLGSSVADIVARARAAALERVVQTQPVADLVGGRVAEVVLCLAAAGNGGRTDDNAIEVEVLGARGHGLGEVGVAQVFRAGGEVDVEV